MSGKIWAARRSIIQLTNEKKEHKVRGTGRKTKEYTYMRKKTKEKKRRWKDEIKEWRK
jgi:1,2-phenylacetyl-CoA epoxidase PaaB subunit